MKDSGWKEVDPEIVWTGSTAPSGERKVYLKREGDSITIKANFGNYGCNIKEFELKFDL